jgi:CDP-6-deoxy-D-xylo-4-hexulose-3-dehydrase
MGREAELRIEILRLVEQYYQERFGTRTFRPGTDTVHYAGRVFDSDEVVKLVDSSLGFFLTASRFSEQFEAEFAEFFGLGTALLVNSGSSANLVALTALTSAKLGERRLRPGDEVITVAAAFPTTGAPVVQKRVVPVFVDVTLASMAPISTYVEPSERGGLPCS